MTIATVEPAAVDYDAIKARQQATWASGDYATVGTTLQIMGESLCEALDLAAGARVLDVAAGNGNATLAAARRFARVVSSDYVPALLEKGRERAAAERLPVDFRVADAEALPFADGEFDVALSVVGVMFAPNQTRAAAEMARVTRPGGHIGLASWTPEGFIGELFRTIGRHVPPPAGLQSPALWGTEAHLRALFGDALGALRAERRTFNFRYRSADHFIDIFRSYYGPVHKAFAALAAEGQRALEDDLRALLGRSARRAEPLVVPSEYLEAVLTRV